MRVENSFIGAGGIGETIERRLWRAGVTHWDDFGGEAVGPTRADRIRSFVADGRRALDAGDAGFFDAELPSSCRWRLYENFRDDAVFFDIETTGLDHRHSVVTTVTTHRNGSTETLVRGEDLTEAALRAEFAGANLLVSFNGIQFDVPFLEACFDVDLQRPHIDLRFTCGKLGLRGGLSAVEDALGIERELPDISGEDAVRLWREHQRGVDGSLETLIRYNRADTENMVTVIEDVTDRLHDEVFAEEAATEPAEGFLLD